MVGWPGWGLCWEGFGVSLQMKIYLSVVAEVDEGDVVAEMVEGVGGGEAQGRRSSRNTLRQLMRLCGTNRLALTLVMLVCLLFTFTRHLHTDLNQTNCWKQFLDIELQEQTFDPIIYSNSHHAAQTSKTTHLKPLLRRRARPQTRRTTSADTTTKQPPSAESSTRNNPSTKTSPNRQPAARKSASPNSPPKPDNLT